MWRNPLFTGTGRMKAVMDPVESTQQEEAGRDAALALLHVSSTVDFVLSPGRLQITWNLSSDRVRLPKVEQQITSNPKTSSHCQSACVLTSFVQLHSEQRIMNH